MNSPFYFYTRLHLVRLLGLKARNPRELLDCIKKAPASSIYYHTHRFLQQHHYLSPEPPNDFAYWLGAINAKELSEALASIDTVSFRSIEELRSEFLRILSEYISDAEPPSAPGSREPNQLASVADVVKAVHEVARKRRSAGAPGRGNHIPESPEGQEFHFMGCVTFVLPIPYVAHDLKEFAETLEKVSINSIYFHMFEARLRLEREQNDFAAWFENIGQPKLAEEVSRIDPYTITLEKLREKIIEMVNRYA